MRLRTIVLCALVCGPACRGDGPKTGGSEVGPKKIASSEIGVTIRNNCPEAVELYFSEGPPAADVEPVTLSANAAEQRQIGSKHRMWLRYRGAWQKDRSVRPEAEGWVLEIHATCDGVGGRKGPL